MATFDVPGALPDAYRVMRLLYLMAPAYLANMTPPFVRFWHGWNRPICERWLGSHKTVVGAASGILVAMATAGVQRAIAWEGSLMPYDRWPLVGLLLGIGAIGGDALKSFAKRRIGIAPGQRWIPFDQLDFVVGALAFVAAWADLSWADVGEVLVVSVAGDIVVNQVAYRLGIRETSW